MDERRSLKHSPVRTVLLELVQTILRSAVNGRSVGLEEAIRVLDCDADHANRVLRQMAEAGYLEPADILDGLFYWQLTPNGTRLATESKRKRIGRDKVQTIISELLARAKVINSDPNRLQRITLKLCKRRPRPIDFALARRRNGMTRRAAGSSSGTTRRGPYASRPCWA